MWEHVDDIPQYIASFNLGSNFAKATIVVYPANLFASLFNHTDEEILTLFAMTKEAFINSDEEKAKQCWEYERKLTKKCDHIVETLAKGNLTVNEAVTFTLIARYFKRIAAHLTNIATSVILPISDLDYFDEDRRNEE